MPSMILRFRSVPCVCLLAGCALFSLSAAAQSIPAKPDSASLLARAKTAMRFERASQSVIHYHAVSAAEQNYQSDRTYPPFFSAMHVEEAWFDPQTGVERLSTQTTFPGSGPTAVRVVTTDATRAFGVAEEHLTPLPPTSAQSRNLNPWTVIADWAAASDVRFAGSETYRDYPRYVLVRNTPAGQQRLFLDPKSGFPVKLDFEENHYLWGQRHIEYLYTNWTLAGGVMVPGSSFRLADGKIEISRTTGEVEILPLAAAPSLALPETPSQPADALPLFLQPIDPTTTQVGPKTYLLNQPRLHRSSDATGRRGFSVRRHPKRGARKKRRRDHRKTISRVQAFDSGGHRPGVAACRRRSLLGREWCDHHRAPCGKRILAERRRQALDNLTRSSGTTAQDRQAEVHWS